MILKVLRFLFCLALAWQTCVLADVKADDELLSRVCSDKPREWPVFTSPAQVRALSESFAAAADAGSSPCPDRYAEAFSALKELLRDDSATLEDICSEQAYERLREFHVKFVHFYVPELSRDELKEFKKNSSSSSGSSESLAPIPVPLRRFFIAFAKQINGACKQQAVARLKQVLADKKLVGDEDFAVIAQYKRESRRLGFMYELTKLGLSSYGNKQERSFNNLEVIDLIAAKAHGAYGNILKRHSETEAAAEDSAAAAAAAAGEVAAQGNESKVIAITGDSSNSDGNGNDAQELDVDDGTKLYVQVRFDDRLKRIKEACLKRFVPIYSELLLPVIKLNNLGYVDHSHTWLEDRDLNDEEGELHKWLDIIQACEVLKDVEILHDSSALQALVGIIQDNSHFAIKTDLKPKSSSSSSSSSVSSLPEHVKILSRAEANALQSKVESAEEGSVRPLYDPDEVHLDHVRVSFTPRLWITDAKNLQTEADNFERDLERTIKRKTSSLRLMLNDWRFRLKNLIYRSKSQIQDKDEASALGRIAMFVEKHQNLIKGVGIVISIIVISTVLAGR